MLLSFLTMIIHQIKVITAGVVFYCVAHLIQCNFWTAVSNSKEILPNRWNNEEEYVGNIMRRRGQNSIFKRRNSQGESLAVVWVCTSIPFFLVSKRCLRRQAGPNCNSPFASVHHWMKFIKDTQILFVNEGNSGEYTTDSREINRSWYFLGISLCCSSQNSKPLKKEGNMRPITINLTRVEKLDHLLTLTFFRSIDIFCSSPRIALPYSTQSHIIRAISASSRVSIDMSLCKGAERRKKGTSRLWHHDRARSTGAPSVAVTFGLFVRKPGLCLTIF